MNNINEIKKKYYNNTDENLLEYFSYQKNKGGSVALLMMFETFTIFIDDITNPKPSKITPSYKKFYYDNLNIVKNSSNWTLLEHIINQSINNHDEIILI